MAEAVSAVVVSYSDPAASIRALDSLLGQSNPPSEVLVVDNHPERLFARALSGWESRDRVRLVHSGQNLGYTAACNLAAAEAHGDWLFFLNPDARADRDCLRNLTGSADLGTGAVGAQVLLPDGRANAGDNPVHITGIAWAGRYGQPREYGPARPVASVSGAALLVRTEAFREIGGMCERFFMYEDDVDLCWRVRLAGREVLFCPEAVVSHDYEFDKGSAKWYWLERNRVWAVLSNYSLLSLVVLAPMLAATEMMIAVIARRDGWGRDFGRAWGSNLSAFPELLRWRRQVQRTRRASDRDIVALMCGRFETPLLESAVARRLNPLLALYRRSLLRILTAAGT